MRAYRQLFAHGNVRWLIAAAVTTRVVTPVLSLSLLLAVRSGYGSFALGGIALAGYSLAYATSAPLTGRLSDRITPRPVLLGCLGVHVCAYAALVTALSVHAPAAVLVCCTVVLGGSVPPAGPVVRGSWAAVVPEDQLRTAYALDAVINEATLITGPLFVALLVAFVPARFVLVAAGVAMSAGILLLLRTPSIRSRGLARERTRRGLLGPLAFVQVRVVLGIVVFDSFTFGCSVVAITAAATSAHAASGAGLLIGVMSAGVVVSGLAYGARQHGDNNRTQLVVLYLAGGLVLLTAAFVTPLALLGAVLLVMGLIGGPRDTLVQLLVGQAGKQQRTEAFGWLATVSWAGYGIGSSTAGQVVGPASGHAMVAFLIGAGANVVAAIIACGVAVSPEPAADVQPAVTPAAES